MLHLLQVRPSSPRVLQPGQGPGAAPRAQAAAGTPARRLPARCLGLLAALGLACTLGLLPPGSARAQGIELATLELQRDDSALTLDFAVRLTLPPVVQEALNRGVPVYFVAEARLLRSRWYWRDERVARVARQWRVAYQPLTSTWRVGQGGLQQSLPTLAEALATVSRSSGWQLAESTRLDPGGRYYVEFSYRLDTSQLPGPMQFGLGGLGGQGEWAVGVDRTLRLE